MWHRPTSKQMCLLISQQTVESTAYTVCIQLFKRNIHHLLKCWTFASRLIVSRRPLSPHISNFTVLLTLLSGLSDKSRVSMMTTQAESKCPDFLDCRPSGHIPRKSASAQGCPNPQLIRGTWQCLVQGLMSM